jgi:hypothetical protein
MKPLQVILALLFGYVLGSSITTTKRMENLKRQVAMLQASMDRQTANLDRMQELALEYKRKSEQQFYAIPMPMPLHYTNLLPIATNTFYAR